MPSPTTLKLPEELKARLSAQAQTEGKTPHSYMLDALREKVDRADRREYLDAGAATTGQAGTHEALNALVHDSVPPSPRTR